VWDKHHQTLSVGSSLPYQTGSFRRQNYNAGCALRPRRSTGNCYYYCRLSICAGPPPKAQI